MASFIYFSPGEPLTLTDLDLTFQVCGVNINAIENRQIQPLSLDWMHYAPPIGSGTDPDILWTSSGPITWGDLSAYTVHSPQLQIAALFSAINDNTIVAPATAGTGWVLTGPSISGSNVFFNSVSPPSRFNSMFFSASIVIRGISLPAVQVAYIAVQFRDMFGNWVTLPSSVRAAYIEYSNITSTRAKPSVALAVEGLVKAADLPGSFPRAISGMRVVSALGGPLAPNVANYLELDSSSLVVLFLEGT